ncbi:MAG: HU family DNA-binding protein [Kiritimatiellia bacterium]
MTKSQLAAELAEKSGTSVKSVLMTLDTLAEIAYRETTNGFVIPGICKLSVAKRKPRKFRHPATGQLYQISERLSVAISPLKKCRMQALPRQENLITPMEEPIAEAPAGTLQSSLATVAQSDAPQANNPAGDTLVPDTNSIVLECEYCGNTVAAPAEYAGMLGQCPFCGGEITIPTGETDGTELIETDATAIQKKVDQTDFTTFVTFICNACDQEIEAPKSMVGAEAICPSCGTPVFVPAEDQTRAAPLPQAETDDNAQKPDLCSMTIRIDLSDLA